ncbi:MAG: hypothetical protein K6A78_10525 [Prevotella sp.]|nr:hypothetical protein [Prevotella sp.]
MKKLLFCAMLAIAGIGFTSCDQKQSAIDDLRTFAEDLQQNSDQFDEKAWDEATDEYQKLVDRLEKYEYTDEERKEIGRLKARCYKEMGKAAVQQVEKELKNAAKEIEGALEELGI